VRNYRIFGHGFLLIHGKIITLPVDHGTQGLLPSLFKVIRFLNGSRLHRILFYYGSTGNVSCRLVLVLLWRLIVSPFAAGAGKGVFWYVLFYFIFSWELTVSVSSTIIGEIDDAMRKSGLASLAFFYCDFREDQKKTWRGFLSSVLVQLCHQSDSYCDILSKFYSEHENGCQDPNDKELACCLKHLLELRGQTPVYLIVDALDECPKTSAMPSPREEVLTLLEQLINSQHTNLRICVTSRRETDIKAVLEPLTFRSVSLR